VQTKRVEHSRVARPPRPRSVRGSAVLCSTGWGGGGRELVGHSWETWLVSQTPMAGSCGEEKGKEEHQKRNRNSTRY